MIRTVLLAGPLLLGMPMLRGAAQTPAFAVRPAAEHVNSDGAGWRAKALKPLSFDVAGGGADDARSVTAVVDYQAMMAELPLLQQHGAVSKDITKEDMDKRPTSYANAFSLLLLSYAVHDLYAAHPEIDVTHWKVLLATLPGKAGQDGREMYAFSFDRSRYDALVWDKLPFTELPNVADKFSYNLRFTLDMSQEVGGSINDD